MNSLRLGREGLSLLVLASLVCACSTPVGTGGDADASNVDATDVAVVAPVAIWQLPRSGPNAFQLPWPSDLTLHSDGTIDLHYVPNPAHNGFVVGYADTLDHRIDGFSTVASTFFRFSVPVDTSTLPADLATTLEAGSSVQLIDIDSASPGRGTRHPVQWYFRETQTRYWTPNTLAVAPAYGYPLRPHTRYAIVITRGLHAAGGAAFARDADLDAVLATTGGDANVIAARTLHAPAVAEIAGAGVTADQILSIAVFRTQDPTSELFRAAEAVHHFDAPAFVDIRRTADGPPFVTYMGHYGPTPIFQSGAQPYDTAGTGDFIDDATGTPMVQARQNITFALTTPTGEPPAGGWPIVIYAHGTGGDATSFIGDGTARALAEQGLAVLGFDQIFNGDRTIGMPSLAAVQFFNFQNPLAGRNNNRQAALDLVQTGRLVRTMTIPADVSLSGSVVSFDASHVMFFGHSQGGLNGPLWLAAENGAGAAVLSGAGGTLSLSITQKTEPINIPQVVAVVLGIPTSTAADELVPFHPVIAMAQTVVDVADPVNYARFILREPRTGNPPRHIYQTEGFIDHYAPNDGIESVAMAIGLPLVMPTLHPVNGYSLNHLAEATAPLRLNLAGGTTTGAWQQFDMARRSDGHFVVFDIPAARDRAAAFLGSYAHATGSIPSIM